MKKKVSSVAVFNRKGHLLLLRRSKTAPWKPYFWDFPGGLVDAGEIPIQAAVREVYEESGLILDNIDYLTTRIGHVVTYFFTSEYKGLDGVTLSYEHDRYEWVDIDEIESYDIDIIERVVDCIKYIKNESN